MHGRRLDNEHEMHGPSGRGPGPGPGSDGDGRWGHRRGRGRGHGRGPGRHGRGGRRRRVSRGEVRVAVLALLSEEPMHGYQIMQELAERSDGGWDPSPGSIYPTLQQLSDEGLVTGESSEGRNVFSLTDAGREQADAETEAPIWERFQEGGAGPGQLRRAMMQVGAATRQVGMAGTEAQVEQALAVLTDTRKRLYQILAED